MFSNSTSWVGKLLIVVVLTAPVTYIVASKLNDKDATDKLDRASTEFCMTANLLGARSQRDPLPDGANDQDPAEVILDLIAIASDEIKPQLERLSFLSERTQKTEEESTEEQELGLAIGQKIEAWCGIQLPGVKGPDSSQKMSVNIGVSR